MFKWFATAALCFYLSQVTFSQNTFWEPTNGPVNVPIKALVVNPNGDLFAGTEGAGLFRSKDNGQSWEVLPLGCSNIASIGLSSAGDVLVSCGGEICRSTDLETNWVCDDTLISVQDFEVTQGEEIFAVDFFNGLYRSTDDGVTWLSTELRSSYYTTVEINSENNIFVGGVGIIRSTDYGNTWTGISSAWGNPLLVSQNDYIFATYGSPPSQDSLLRSTDNGNTWSSSSNGITARTILCLAENSIGHLFAGTLQGGVFLSTNNGDLWKAINSGLTRDAIYSLAIGEDGYIYAGTDSAGVFRSVRSTTSVGDSDGNTPKIYKLNQNYPNPFNPSTEIQYALPTVSFVTIKVYTLLGQEVVTLMNGDQEAGYHLARWDGRNLRGELVGSGMYFYRMEAKTDNGDLFVRTKKMLFIK